MSTNLPNNAKLKSLLF